MVAGPLALLLALGLTRGAAAASPDTSLDATAIRQRVLANRPARDYALKARLLVRSDPAVPVEILVKSAPGELRTLYRSGAAALLVIQPDQGAERLYRRGSGELKGPARLEHWLGSEFSCYDLGAPFLRWPQTKLLEEQRVRGRDCYVLEGRASGEPYARVRSWIDKEYFALLRAEAFDANEALVKRFMVTSFKKIGGAWVPRGIEVATVPPGQSLPAQEKSRLEVYEGAEDASLPADLFAPDSF